MTVAFDRMIDIEMGVDGLRSCLEGLLEQLAHGAGVYRLSVGGNDFNMSFEEANETAEQIKRMLLAIEMVWDVYSPVFYLTPNP